MFAFGHLSSLGPSHMTGPGSADQIMDVWWIEWAYYALIHGHNPLFTNWQNYPNGYNAGANTSMLALGMVTAPVTFIFGPVVSWNILERAAPFLSAVSMCLVLRRCTKWWPASFVGGLLYGFSVYVTSSDQHLNIAFVPLPPLFFLLLYELLVRQEWRPGRTGALLGLVCGIQFFISSEILTSMVIMGALATGLWALANRTRISLRGRYLKTAVSSAVLVGALLLVYPIYFTLLGPMHIGGVPNPPGDLAALHGDLLGPIVPGYTQRFVVPRLLSLYLINSTPLYVGLPFVASIVVVVVLLRKRGLVLLAGAMALVSLLLSLGSTLYVGGKDTHFPLPFTVLAHLPLTQGLLSTRFSLYTIFFGAMIVAIGIDALHVRLATSPRLGRTALRRRELVAIGISMAVALIIALPILPSHQADTRATGASPFFSSLDAAENIPAGSAVLAYPYPDNPVYPGSNLLEFSFSPRYQDVNNALLDQAVSGMYFRLIGGYAWRPNGATFGVPSPNDLHPESVKDLFDFAFYGVTTRSGQAEVLVKSNLSADLRKFAEQNDVETVVVLPVGQQPATAATFLTAALGPPAHVDRALVWFHVKRRLETVRPGAEPRLEVAPPTTAVVAPTSQEELTGSPTLVATASADLGVSGVTFRITGQGRTIEQPAVAFSYGWACKWNTASLANGTYTLRSVAYEDESGQTTTSAAVVVRVNNG
jgi:hypothetical protein